MTTALAAKIASSTPGLPLKVRAENVTLGRSKSGTQVSPRSVANAIRLDQFSEQEKKSVIKLLLSSPILATNPVLSTKSVAGTSPPVENPLPSSKKLSKGKKGAAVLEGSPTDLANLKLALSTKKKKSATIKIENVEEPEKSRPFNYDLDIDSSTLDTHGDVPLMEIEDDDGLMMSEEEIVHAKPVKSAKKKQGKAKGSAKKGTTKMGDLSSHTGTVCRGCNIIGFIIFVYFFALILFCVT